jgi:peptidyl-prolyl cis-trans isomerase D
MAMMAKMRSLAPAFILTVGALFVLFMVISDSNVLEALGGRTNNVGSINGDDISYQDFSKSVDQQLEIQKKQTGKDVDQDKMDQFRDQVWESLINETLIEQQVKKYNISISDEEIRNTILGDNPPQFLKQNFIDSTGKFNRSLYESALYNPQNKDILIQAEDYVRQSLLRQKLQSMLLASITVSEGEIKRNFVDRNIKIDAKYAVVNLLNFPDSAFKVSDDDLKGYYNNNLDKYEIKPQRKIKYVLFQNKASGEDTNKVRDELLSIKRKIVEGSLNFKDAVNVYSSVPYSRDSLNISNYPKEVGDSLYMINSGLIGPVLTPQGYALYKVDGTYSGSATFVNASHILINQFGSDEKNYDEAMKIYNSLKQGADFSKLAKEKSADPGSAAKGGSLGWFGKGAMIPEFEKASFNGPVGVVQKPIKTTYGYHIIKVNAKSNKIYVTEKIVEPVRVSPSTRDANYNAAQDFAYISNKNDFDNEAKLMHYNIRESNPFYKEAASVPGIATSKNLVDFAFNNDLNTISDVYKVNDGYVVAKVSDVIKEGVKPFEDVKNQIKPLVIREKKYEKALGIAKNIKSKINGDLDKAGTVYPKTMVDTTGQFLAQGPVPKIGRDYAFLEEAKQLEVNKISDPVKGLRGYYLIKVTYRTPFDSSTFDIQKNTIRDNLLRQKKSTFFNEWIASLKKGADIVDKRYLFYNR